MEYDPHPEHRANLPAERRQRRGWVTPTMQRMLDLCADLEAEGWRPIHTCPKVGRFIAWDPLAEAPYLCRFVMPTRPGHYDASWIAYYEGEEWPAHPCYWRELDGD